MNSIFNKKTIYTFISGAVILVGTIVAIQYAKGGYRLTDDGFRPETGLLAANSFPSGAQVIVNDKLVAATDDTIYLTPGSYVVSIQKDGYTSWNKTVTIEKELVVQTNAKLFPIAPSLTNLTFTGIENASPAPDGRRLIYYTASASAERKSGLYLYEMVDNPLPLQRGPQQISYDSNNFDLSTARFIWSPDSTQVMVISNDRQVLLDLDSTSDLDTLADVSFRSSQILSEWEQEMYLRERQFLSQFPDEMIKIATKSAKNVYISPDKKRLLYTATADGEIPDTIVPPVPATNSQPEQRALEAGGIYVYDREEDRNFQVGREASDSAQTVDKMLLALDLYNDDPDLATAAATLFSKLQATEAAQTAQNFNTYHTSLYANTFQWFPDSRHLLFIQDNSINIMEYDGTNKTTLYSGPFDKSFLYPWPDGSRLMMSTSFSPDSPHNLYAIELE